jgi:1-pyrroline-4-hydroxy-2-carboxylate deaminase
LKHLDVLVNGGVHGFVMLGTVGENCSLEFHEKMELLQACVEHLNGSVPVLTGVAEYTTDQACRYADAAKQAGVDGLMVLPAMVYKTDVRETVTHFREVARATDLPIMIYNNPVSYGVDIKPETFAELADEPRFTTIKESSEDPRRITQLRRLCGDRFQLFAGVDDLVLESLVLGIDGWVSGLVNAFPVENRLIWDLVKADRWSEAREVYRWYSPLLRLDTLPKLVQYIKLAVSECGYGSELTRPPRLPIEGEERARILAIIRKGIETRPNPADFGL